MITMTKDQVEQETRAWLQDVGCTHHIALWFTRVMNRVTDERGSQWPR